MITQEDFERYSSTVSQRLNRVAIDIHTTSVALRLTGELRAVPQEIEKKLRAKRLRAPGKPRAA